jgi:hypothetical protein
MRCDELRVPVNVPPNWGFFAHVCSMSKDMSGCASTAYVVTSNLASGSAEPSALSVVVTINVVGAHTSIVKKGKDDAHE